MFSFVFLFSFKAIKIKNSDIGLIVGILASVSFLSNTSAKIGNIFCIGKVFRDYLLFALPCCRCRFITMCCKSRLNLPYSSAVMWRGYDIMCRRWGAYSCR